MNDRITRHQGTAVAGTPYVVGGGVSGATKPLDDLVQEMAEALAARYDREVVIRFNSDRRSGGAWLVTDETDAIGANADVGLTVSLFETARLRASYARYPDPDETIEDRLRNEGFDPANPPESFTRIHAHVSHRFLADPSHATSMLDTPETSYAHVPVDSVEDAFEFLSRTVRFPEAPAPAPAMR